MLLFCAVYFNGGAARIGSGLRLEVNMGLELQPSASEIILYTSSTGKIKVDVRLEDETVWLTQVQMAELFGKGRTTITEHIQNVFSEGELDERVVCRDFRHTTQHGAIAGKTQEKILRYYNLDVIISVGYRVKSPQGTQFRIWATQRLKEFIVKGFVLDDERLKRAGGDGYFEELLGRIRDIRSSEKVFWKKVLEIYATSIDYDSNAESSQLFFKTIQNKMHWAAHGHTAAEIIAQRADASKPHMGLTHWSGDTIKKTDATIAKNYLNAEEIDNLNRIVTAYLEFAELQARNRRPMHMHEWITKLDDFLKLSERDILTHAGKISHQAAILKAEAEFGYYRSQQSAQPSRVEQDFQTAIDKIKRLEAELPKKEKREKEK